MQFSITVSVNPLTSTLKLQSNGPLHSNTVIVTLTVVGWAVTFGTARKGLANCGSAQSPPHCVKWPVYKRHIIQRDIIITCALN